MAKLDDRIAILAAKLQELKTKQQTKERGERQAERQKARKAENQRKFQLGGLFKVAELFDLDKGALLGALLHVKPLLHEPQKFAEMKRAGDALLERRVQERNEAACVAAAPAPLTDDYLQ